MIPARFAPVVFGFILSGLMSFIVSGIAILRTAGFAEGLFGLWIGAWITSWLVAFPTVLVVAPLTRRIVAKLLKDGPA
ncbi:DUF2798 domain-containing protein [Sulfitobacter sp. CW3]|jgi:hypothetical protein|uniref:DUF2798 domain-containing protein n=1 Tax=Sulfitobacter sp. CW3 TaxID=2861965 RepID=UPI001C5CEE27|nr:DUF2798 domain-containing protein [Sulfitobacter sp. CW3]MBW4962676.1 DUF2798 domain-containing protein [Sulfitobacter sp. CW3]